MKVKGFIYLEGGPADGWRRSIVWGTKNVAIPELRSARIGTPFVWDFHTYAITDRYKPEIGRIFTYQR